MGESHRVRFEPVDLEMDVEEDETVLDAAFRQGITLMHGCREGQCSACKSFLIEGDVQLARYSTFALADYESDEGYVLLCKTHAYSDLVVELINYDEEVLRSAVPIQHVTAVITALTPLTSDIVSLRLQPVEDFVFKPGQYVDITIPGTDRHRSFSMATTPETAELEFIIKRYPGGHFSGLLDGDHDGLRIGDELQLTGPYGAFTLRDSSERRVVCIGGGAGMAPILSLLRHLVRIGTRRPVVFYYGARTAEDLFYLPEIAALGQLLDDFRFVPALSLSEIDHWGELGVEGRFGLITDVVDQAEPDLSESDFYLCGPPPMVDAAVDLLARRDVPRDRVFFDKFTTASS